MRGGSSLCLAILLDAFLSDATWLFLSQLQLMDVPGSRNYCSHIPGFVKRQKHLCMQNPEVLPSITQGAKDSIQECQFQFRNHRWNCSVVSRDVTVFGKYLLKFGSREAAFVYALSSAAVVYAVTRSCSAGVLKGCGCGATQVAGQIKGWNVSSGPQGAPRSSLSKFLWGGCAESVKFGKAFAKRFVDAREKYLRDARALMNLHNNKVGRKAVEQAVRTECKCHGVSGSCAARTCWKELRSFRVVGTYLKEKYDGATEVMMNQEGSSLTFVNKDMQLPTKGDLVYFEPSPSYCERNDLLGSLGTAGRVCDRNSQGPGGCEILCCGRGYDTRRVFRRYKCDCQFLWCCSVKCQECSRWENVYTCKNEGVS